MDRMNERLFEWMDGEAGFNVLSRIQLLWLYYLRCAVSWWLLVTLVSNLYGRSRILSYVL
jgi:hypothetical protein